MYIYLYKVRQKFEENTKILHQAQHQEGSIQGCREIFLLEMLP